MTINLHKDLASSGWHSSIVTTYSVDPAFYDMYVERRLRRHGVKNNILMADARMLKAALNGLPEAFTAAGVRYAVVPVSIVGAFHPKVHLRLGENKARLVIGSANATTAGWGKNQEVVALLNWHWRGDDKGDNSAIGPLVAKAYAYLERWLGKTPGDSVRYKVQLMERQSQWLHDLRPSMTPVTLSDNSAVDLLCESGGDSPSTLKQFSDLAAQEQVRRLIVVSPYWDANLRGFRDLRKTLGTPTTLVALNPRRNAFPVELLRKGDSLKFVAIDKSVSSKFLHAKILIAETRKADHVLFGSANCSDDALGHLRGVSRNAEVSVYRRLPPGSALESLGIDTSNVVPRAEILPSIFTPRSSTKLNPSLPAGVIELRGQALAWWPPSASSVQGAAIELNGVSFTLHEGGAGKWTAEFTGAQTFPLIARIRYRDGRLSDPVIVHSETRLRKATPGQIDPRFNDALDKARGPDGDLIELAAMANVIFEPAARRLSGSLGGRTGKRKEENHKTVEYANEEEFRTAMEMTPGTGKTGRMDEGDPGFHDLFAIIGRGIAGSLPQEDTDDDLQDEALLAGDAEDDADELGDRESDDDDEGAPQVERTRPSTDSSNRARTFTATDIHLRRQKLATALDLFDTMLQGLKRDPSLITSRLAIQTMFVFRLMRYGSTHAHNMGDGSSMKLMVMSEGGLGADRRLSFIFRAAMILKQIWTGDRSIASQIRLDPRQSELPDDIYGFIVGSRWALGRAYLESKEVDAKAANGTPGLFTSRLRRVGKEIYAATVAMGQVDAIEERRTIYELDADFGCTSAQTEELIRGLHDFTIAETQQATAPQAIRRAADSPEVLRRGGQ